MVYCMETQCDEAYVVKRDRPMNDGDFTPEILVGRPPSLACSTPLALPGRPKHPRRLLTLLIPADRRLRTRRTRSGGK